MLTGNDWDEILREEINSDYFKQLQQFLAREYAQYTIYPSMVNIYNALRLTPYANVKAVILGQDPYHGPGQAHGLSFSVQKGVAIPPSLQNIYKEMADDIGFVNPGHGCLTEWARAGGFAAQHGTDGTCRTGWFPPWQRMGAVYRCDYPKAERAGDTDRIYAVGSECTAEKAVD